MDMDRPVRASGTMCVELVRRHGAQANEARRRRLAPSRPATAPRALRSRRRAKRSRSLTKRRWPAVRRLAAKAAMRVEDGKQGQADAGFLGRGRDARRHLGEIRIRRPVAIVVQVMELADPGEAGLEHFDIKLRGHRLDILWAPCRARSGTSPRAKSRSCRMPAREPRRARPCRAGTRGCGDWACREGRWRGAPHPDADRRRARSARCSPPAIDTRMSRANPCGSSASSKKSEAIHRFPKTPRQAAGQCRAGRLCIDKTSSLRPSQAVELTARKQRASSVTMRVNRLWHNARLATLRRRQTGPRRGRGRPHRRKRGPHRLCRARGRRLPPSRPSSASIAKAAGSRRASSIATPTSFIAGDRAHEFELRLAGASYEEVARAGGGIVSTVKATRAASEDELVASALPAARCAHRRRRDDDRDQIRLRARARDRTASAARREAAREASAASMCAPPSSALTRCRPRSPTRTPISISSAAR